jgi:biopolymer transport protein TolQ
MFEVLSAGAVTTYTNIGGGLQTSVLDLIVQSGFMAKGVLLCLLIASVLSWAVIFMKYKTLKRAHKESQAFLHAFWYGQDLDEIFKKSEHFLHSPVANVFKAGFKELKKINHLTHPEEQIANVSRTLVRSTMTEISHLERAVSWLATVGSASPFVGLFGTVWGIMNSFQGIGATGSANLAVVAPGISEALITTAAGLAAAIPAVIFYNYFIGWIRTLSVEMDGFSQDFLNIIQRSITKSK